MKLYTPTSPMATFFIIFLPILLICSLIGWGIAFQQRAVFRQDIKSKELNLNEIEKRLFESTLISYLSDIAMLNEITREELSLEHGHKNSYPALCNYFSSFVRNRKMYDQIRFIDPTGKENIRVEWKPKSGVLVIPADRLQIKKDRQYFIKGMALKQKSYISHFDLNMENNVIERPLKPMIRIAHPIVNEKGQNAGLLVLNLLGKKLIDPLIQLNATSAGAVYLVNDRGDWLKGPSPEVEWEFMFKEKVTNSMATFYPDEWQRIVSMKNGNFISEAGMFIFSTIDPLSLSQHYDLPTNLITTEESWKIINFVPINKFTPMWWNTVVAVLVVMIAIIGISSWFLTLQFIKRMKAIETLSENEKKLNTITDAVQDAIVMIDIHGLAYFWNQAAEKIFGFTAEEIMGKDIHQFITPKAQRHAADRGLESFSKDGKGPFIGRLREVEALRKDGTRFPAELNLNSIQLEGQWWSVGVVRDITIKKQAETEIIALNKNLEKRVRMRTHELETAVNEVYQKERTAELLKAVASIANTAKSENEALEATLTLIAEYIKWPVGHVYLPSEEDEQILKPTSLWYVENPDNYKQFMDITKKTFFRAGQGLPGQIYESKSTLWITDVREEETQFIRVGLTHDFNIRGAFGFPIKISQKVVAVMEFFSAKVQEPDSSILKISDEVANQLSYVIERKHIETALKENERKFRGIFNQSFQLIGLLSTEGEILQANEVALKILGSDEEQIIGKFLWDGPWWPHSEEVKMKIRSAVKAAARGDIVHFEANFMDGDGTIRCIDFSLKPNTDENGKVTFLIPEGRDITEKKQKDAEIKKLAIVAEKTSSGVIITNKTGLVEWINYGFERISGYCLKELIGKRPGDILQGPKSDAQTIGRIGDALGQGNGIKEEIINYHKSGHPYWIEMDIEPIFDDDGSLIQFVAIGNDITERKNAEIELQRFKTILDQTHDAVFMFDPESLLFIYVNQGAIDQVGYTREELMQRCPTDLKPQFTEKMFKDMIIPLLQGESKNISFETIHEHKDGRLIPVEILLQYVKETKESPFFVAIIRDITEWKQTKQELEKAKDAAESATIAKGEFLANMSHEIRTPMNAIIGFTHLIQQTKMTPRQKDYLEKIGISAQSLLEIINNILDFSKINAEKLTLEQTAFNFSELMEDVINVFAGQLADNGTELFLNINEKIPSVLIGDPLRISQILTNLLSNAIKFTKEGIIEIFANIVDLKPDTVKLECSVSDTGIGMSQKQSEKLFQKFSQADTTTTRKYGGTGLGLAICKQLINLMGGSILVKSSPGKGTTFTFSLTLNYKKDRRKQQDSNVIPIDLHGLKVMIMDTQKKSNDHLKHQLESLSFKTDRQSNFAAAYKTLEDAVAKHSPFSLVFMDYRIIKQEGIGLFEKIQTFSHTPFIIIASMKDLTTIESLHTNDKMIRFLTKPITSSHLHNAIVESFGYGNFRIEKRRILAQTRAGQLEQIKGAEVLLVEDNKMNQQVANELLINAQLNVTIANNGMEALELIQKKEFNVVLMDIQMPVMDGITTTRKIRKLKSKMKDIPIIAMTAHAMAGDREKSLDAGMNDHINKPINPDKLYARLLQWVDSNQIKQSDLSQVASQKKKMDRESFDVLRVKLLDIDIDAGLDRVAGNTGLYMTLLVDFMREYDNFADIFKEAMAEKNIEAIRLNIHTLKGISATIGAMKLHKSTKNLETALETESKDLDHSLREFSTELENVLTQLSNAFSRKNDEAETSISDLNFPKLTQEILPKVYELRKLLSENDMESEQIFESIHETLIASMPEKTKQLSAAMESFDFKKASTILEDIMILIKEVLEKEPNENE